MAPQPLSRVSAAEITVNSRLASKLRDARDRHTSEGKRAVDIINHDEEFFVEKTLSSQMSRVPGQRGQIAMIFVRMRKVL
jgi:hypothetical protein